MTKMVKEMKSSKQVVWVGGNADLVEDALVLKMLPRLEKKYPEMEFRTGEFEEDNLGDELWLLDTVKGIEKVFVFSDLKQFSNVPRVTVHDWDLGMRLKLLEKLGKLPKDLKIIGVPWEISEEEMWKQVCRVLENLITSN